VISTNTIVSLALLVIAVASAASAGLLNAGHLGELTIQTCMLIGVFASVAAVLLVQLWRVQDVGGGGRFQLPPAVRTSVYIGIFICVGLFAFDNRRTAMLTDIPERASLSMSRYCKAKKPVIEDDAVPTQVRKVRGCALILRAYRLGYAKKLGPCAPKKIAAKKKAASTPGTPDGACRDRHKGEPLLHYAWRVLADKANKGSDTDPIATVKRSLREFKTKLGHVDTLIASQKHAITASPHAAHHLWVNLPKPHGKSLISRYLVPGKDCSNLYTDMKQKLGWPDGEKGISALIAHAFGRLLFDPLLGDPAGYCREYTIHWGAPDDSCTRLTNSPTSFLSSSGALSSVRSVLQRHAAKANLRQLAKKLGKKPPKNPLPDPRRLVSFQCLIVDDNGSGKLSRTEASIDGTTLAIREVRGTSPTASGDGQLVAYKKLALLLGGVHYNGPVDQSGIADLASRPSATNDVVGADFALTRLDLLRQSDPFVAGSPAMSEQKLVDVFPFRFHLQNFVDAFRRAYRRQRGRL